jgi:two-component system chemotaxis response regulator CheY
MTMTVLVVDDSRLIRTHIKGLMNSLISSKHLCDCSYIEANNGEEGLRILYSRSVDLVFLDWNMPKLSGIDFLKEVRSTERFQNLPVIMITGDTDREHILSALQSGVTDYIAKPIEKDIFSQKVIKCMGAISSAVELYV